MENAREEKKRESFLSLISMIFLVGPRQEHMNDCLFARQNELPCFTTSTGRTPLQSCMYMILLKLGFYQKGYIIASHAHDNISVLYF